MFNFFANHEQIELKNAYLTKKSEVSCHMAK